VIAKLLSSSFYIAYLSFLKSCGFLDIGQLCTHAIYATQEALLTHIREGGNQYICFHDVEKAFDSIELPIFLKKLYETGNSLKLWHLLKSWYIHSPSRARLNSCLSDPSMLAVTRCITRICTFPHNFLGHDGLPTQVHHLTHHWGVYTLVQLYTLMAFASLLPLMTESFAKQM